MPTWSWIVLGLTGGVALVWLCALALCHRATVVLRWTHKDDEAAGSQGNTTAHRQNGRNIR